MHFMNLAGRAIFYQLNNPKMLVDTTKVDGFAKAIEDRCSTIPEAYDTGFEQNNKLIIVVRVVLNV